MRILAIETSGRAGSLALLEAEGDAVQTLASASLDSICLETGQRTAQVLAPAMQELLGSQLLGSQPQDIGLVAITVGPGSFTGLRLGVTTAKMFAYATGAELVGVSTLDVLAAQVRQATGRIWTVIDAQRNELFVGQYATPTERVGTTNLMATDDWLAKLAAGDWVNGPILSRLTDRISTEVNVEVNVAAQSLWSPQAATVGEVAWQSYRAGHRDDPWQIVPIYGRLSAAEEKAES